MKTKKKNGHLISDEITNALKLCSLEANGLYRFLERWCLNSPGRRTGEIPLPQKNKSPLSLEEMIEVSAPMMAEACNKSVEEVKRSLQELSHDGLLGRNYNGNWLIHSIRAQNYSNIIKLRETYPGKYTQLTIFAL
jgi:hypothetical protein